MCKLIEGWYGSEETMIDPNDFKINVAATNMEVATYPKKSLDRGDKRPVYRKFRSLSVAEKDRDLLEKIFKKEQRRQKFARRQTHIISRFRQKIAS